MCGGEWKEMGLEMLSPDLEGHAKELFIVQQSIIYWLAWFSFKINGNLLPPDSAIGRLSCRSVWDRLERKERLSQEGSERADSVGTLGVHLPIPSTNKGRRRSRKVSECWCLSVLSGTGVASGLISALSLLLCTALFSLFPSHLKPEITELTRLWGWSSRPTFRWFQRSPSSPLWSPWLAGGDRADIHSK